MIIVLVGFSAITARWFIWPEQGMPSRVDAIVVLDGAGDRLGTALDLARQHRAPVIVISYHVERHHHVNGKGCAPQITEEFTGVKVICFIPRPATTRGEAEFAGRLARQYHWHSIVLVAIAPQDPVALLRAGRCFSGKIYVIDTPLPASELPYMVAYYWGGALQAFFLQRSC